MQFCLYETENWTQTPGRKYKCVQDFGGETAGREPLGRPRLDGSVILKWNFKKWLGDMEWFDLALDRGRWRAVVNAVMKFKVP